jgi:hypothetical protein
MSCGLQPSSPAEGITSGLERKLRSSKKTHRNQPEEERWQQIYHILFPEEAVPSACKFLLFSLLYLCFSIGWLIFDGSVISFYFSYSSLCIYTGHRNLQMFIKVTDFELVQKILRNHHLPWSLQLTKNTLVKNCLEYLEGRSRPP